MNHRPIVAALIVAPLAALAAQAAVAFRDIPPNHWARKPAGILAENKIMPGRTPVDFSGEVPLIRYELAKMLSQLYNVEGPPATFVVLKDMPPGHDATLEVQRVLGYQLMPPRKPGVFDGEAAVTRKEIVMAFDTLLDQNGVSPPQRRKQPAFFTDIPEKSPLTPVLDRVVNRYGLLDAKGRTQFRPDDVVTRFQVLAMLIKAMPYLNAQVDREIREATRPTPPPSPSPLPSGASAPPATPTPEPSEWPTYLPETPTPTATPEAYATPVGGPLLRTRARGQGELLVMYGEELPSESGAIVAGEQRQFSGSMLGGGGLAGEYWGGRGGGTFSAGSYLVGLNVPDNGKFVPEDMLDTFITAGGWYKTASGPDWELAVGGVGVYRMTFNQTGKLLGKYYLTTDKSYIGGGPGAMHAIRLSPELTLTTTLAGYPLMQTYNLPRVAKSLTRWGLDAHTRASYALGGGWSLDGGVHAFLSGALSGGSQTMLGAFFGASGEF